MHVGRLFLTVAAAAAIAGCAKPEDVSTSMTAQSTDRSATDAAVTSATSSAASAGFAIPVYPGAVKDAGKSMDIQDHGTSVEVASYASKDDSETVAAWYKAHLPAAWGSVTISSGAKTAATFSSPDGGEVRQSVIVTGGDAGGSEIQISTKTGA
jgi:hypothetical protein